MMKRLLSLISFLLMAFPVYALDTKVATNQLSVSKAVQSQKLINKLREPSWKSQTKTDNGGWGGGTVVLRGGDSPILYDLYAADPYFQESFKIKTNLPETAFLRSMGYEYFNVQQMVEYAALLQHLERWRPKAPGLVRLIIQSLQDLKVSYTMVPFIRIDGLVETRPLEVGHQVEPVILFNRMMKLRLYLPYWQKMGDQSRLGALIHESFRNMQIVAGLNQTEPEMDLKIAKITQLLTMQDPSEIEEVLDYTQFFDGNMLLHLSNAENGDGTSMQRNLNTGKILDNFPQVTEAMKLSEQFIRDYIQYPQEFSPNARFQAEAHGKALRLYNKYLQERWLDDSFGSLAMDVKTLLLLQLEFRKSDIFGETEKYGCLTGIQSSVPVDKMQSRESVSMLAGREKEDARKIECLQKAFGDEPKMLMKYIQLRFR